MKILRFMNLLVVGMFVLASTTVSPVAASGSIVVPPLQSGVTLTAVGQYCGVNGPCFRWGFDFDPAGGPISGLIEDTIQLDDGNGGTATYHLSGTQSGYFEGGDGGRRASPAGCDPLRVSAKHRGSRVRLSPAEGGARAFGGSSTPCWKVCRIRLRAFRLQTAGDYA